MAIVESPPHATKRIPRTLLRRFISPRTLQNVRYRWWSLSSDLPRSVSSHFTARSPQVRGFGAVNGSSSLAAELQKVNMVEPTRMCRVMTKYGSDKGRLHRYTTIYSALFKERYGQALRILELGLGTNNPDVPSNMGLFGAPGASLRGWRELFPKALIYGADVDRRILFSEDRIKTFHCDQLDGSSIRSLWSQPDLQDGVDILIEDGLHTFEGNISFLEGSIGHVRPGGIYITEDIMWNDVESWYSRIADIYVRQYPKLEFAFVALVDGENRASNNMLVIRRGVE